MQTQKRHHQLANQNPSSDILNYESSKKLHQKMCELSSSTNLRQQPHPKISGFTQRSSGIRVGDGLLGASPIGSAISSDSCHTFSTYQTEKRVSFEC